MCHSWLMSACCNRAGLLVVSILLSGSGAVIAHPSHHHQVERLSVAITQQPASQDLYIERGIAYSSGGEFEQALADFKHAETLGDPRRVAFDLGVLFYRMGQADRAIDYFNSCLENNNQHIPALEYRARVLRDAGHIEAAISDFLALFSQQSQPNPGHYISAAQLMVASKQFSIDGALTLLDQGLARLGLIPQLQDYAIELELNRGNILQAIDRHRTLEPSMGNSPEWQTAMGKYLSAAGREQQAQDYFQVAYRQLVSGKKTTARLKLKAELELLLMATP